MNGKCGSRSEINIPVGGILSAIGQWPVAAAGERTIVGQITPGGAGHCHCPVSGLAEKAVSETMIG